MAPGSEPSAAAPAAAKPRIVGSMQSAPLGAARRHRARSTLFVLGVLALAFNLRPAVTAVPPILGEVGSQLRYSPVVVTLLATTPVLCFGVFSPLATRMGRRLGDERALGIAVATLAAGLAGRALFPSGGFFAGTVAAAGGIACMNVLLSSLVKRRMPEHVGALLGGYLALLYVGAMTSSATSVPLYRAGGRHVSLALGIWALPAVAALVCWVPQLRHRSAGAAVAGVVRPPLVRRALAWQVTGFMGLQSLTYYALVSFLPELFRSRGLGATGAGLVNTVLNLGGLLSALAAPTLVQRFGLARPILLGSTAVGLLATAGTLVVPLGGALALMFFLGLSQGVSISLALYFIMARADTPAVAGALSGMAQGVGYVIAATGPLAAGLLHDATGSWDGPIAALGSITAVTLVFGLLAARERTITADSEPRPEAAG